MLALLGDNSDGGKGINMRLKTVLAHWQAQDG